MLALDWKTGEFVRELTYLSRCLLGHGEIDELDERAFEEKVAEVRASFD